MTLQEKLATVNAKLEELSAEYRSGQTASEPLFKRISVLARQKVNLVEQLRTAK